MADGNNNNSPMGYSIWSAEALAMAEFLMSRLSQPAIALLRFNFGERFFGEATGKIVLFGLLYFLASLTKGGLFSLFLFASFFACMLHCAVIWVRKRRGERWHSRYHGRPLLCIVLPLPAPFIRRWVEPLLLLFLSFSLSRTGQSAALENYLAFAGLSIATIESIAAQRWRRMLLDAQDKQIEAEYFNEALAGKPATETNGFIIPVGMPDLSGKQGESLQSLLRSIYSEMRKALKSLKQEAAPESLSLLDQRQTPAIVTQNAFVICTACNTQNQPNDSHCGYCRAELHPTDALAV
jgi:hypothetical protein